MNFIKKICFKVSFIFSFITVCNNYKFNEYNYNYTFNK